MRDVRNIQDCIESTLIYRVDLIELNQFVVEEEEQEEEQEEQEQEEQEEQ